LEQPGNIADRRILRSGRIGQDKFILVRTHRIHFSDAGQGEPVFLVASTYSSHRIWNRLAPRLAAEYRLLEPDYKIGSTPLEAQTDLIAEMVKQMNIGKVHLIGGPSGSPVVFDFAARHPDLVNKLISIQGGIFAPGPDTRKPANKNWFKLGLGPRKSISLEEKASTIKAPVLYIYGTSSDVDENYVDRNIEFLKNYLPGAWIVSLEGGLSAISRSSPDEISDLILVFLRSNLS